MNHKVLAIIGLSLTLAISGGVVAATSENVKNKPLPVRPTTSETTVSQNNGEISGNGNADDPADGIDATDENGFPIEEITEPETEPEELPTGYDGDVEPSESFEEQLISASMTVKYVVDHTTGAQTSPRVVFGEYYTYCYAAFSEDKRFEICLDPTSGELRKGSYTIYGNIVSVVYDDGVGSEYELLTDEEGNITHVIVNYGNYDVYFG